MRVAGRTTGPATRRARSFVDPLVAHDPELVIRGRRVDVASRVDRSDLELELARSRGVVTYALLSVGGSGDIAPDWLIGVGLGLGGLVGGFIGAGLQRRVPELALRRGLGLLGLALGARYAVLC